MNDVIDVDATSPTSPTSPTSQPSKRTVVDLVDGEEEEAEQEQEQKITPPAKRARRDSEGSSTEEFLPSTETQEAMQQETDQPEGPLGAETMKPEEKEEEHGQVTDDVVVAAAAQQQEQHYPRVYHVVEIHSKGSYRLFELPEDVLRDDVPLFEKIQFAGAATTDEEVQEQTRARSHVLARIDGFPNEHLIAKSTGDEDDAQDDERPGKKVVLLLGTFIVNV